MLLILILHSSQDIKRKFIVSLKFMTNIQQRRPFFYHKPNIQKNPKNEIDTRDRRQ